MGQNESTPIKPTFSSSSAISTIGNALSVQTPATECRLKVQNFVLIWLDSNIDESNADFKHSLTQLRRIVNTIDTFTNADQCVDFLTEVKDEKVFMIVSGTLGQQLVSLIHEIPQLYSIYLFCGDRVNHEVWTNKWAKVKGVFTQIELICNSLEQDTKKCDHDLIPISIVSPSDYSKRDSNKLEPLFMYSQILKEILLTIEYDENVKEELVQLWREQYHNNEFEQDYYLHSPIWWYTRDCFIHQMLNRALRLQEINTILKLGFFIRDLHEQIEQLYKRPSGNLTVYRGQGLSNVDFEKMRTRQGGLLSFNNFLSTSTDRQVSLLYAESSRGNPELTGILFQISINSSLSSTPFASLDKVSFFSDSEKEILFSMHTVFRIGQVMSIEDRLWLVELTLSSDDGDQELKRLTEHMREEIQGGTGWYRLGALLYKAGNFDKAEEVFQILLRETSKDDENQRDHLYQQLGCIKHRKGVYEEALQFYQKTLEIQQKTLPSNYPALAATYNNIGLVHENIGEFVKALEFYQKSLEIQQKYLPPNHPHLAITYNNLGQVYNNMGEYLKGLEFYQKSLEIRQKSLPPNHPDLAHAYNNIGLAHNSMGEHSKALEIHQKALEIRQQSLPPNHPSLAITYNNIAGMHYTMGEYSKALNLYQKTLEIQQKSLPPNHPDLAQTYNNIASVHDSMGEYLKAHNLYEKTLEIRQKSLPPNHPNLAQTYNNIALVHYNRGEYSKSLNLYQKTLEIQQTSLSPNHPDLAITYSNIAQAYCSMREYSKALNLYQKTFEIQQTSLPSNHPNFATSYNNIASVHHSMGDHSKALEMYEKSLKIQQKSLPSNHPHLATTYNNIGWLYKNMGDYSKALSFCERAVQIGQHSLPENHPSLKVYRKNLAALLQYEKNCNVL